jgi:hypothetical protein
MPDHNLTLLKDAARLLQPLLSELVFVGGSITPLLITDKAASDVRPTYDVDAIAEITSYAAYADFSDRLRNLGFEEDTTEGAPICRWRQQNTIFDVMPLDEKILGFPIGGTEQPWIRRRSMNWNLLSAFGLSLRCSSWQQNWKLSKAVVKLIIYQAPI